MDCRHTIWAHVQVLVDHFQLLSIVCCSYAVTYWPSGLAGTLSALSPVPLSTQQWVNLDCLLSQGPLADLLPRSMANILVTSLPPLILLAAAAVSWLAVMLRGKTSGHRPLIFLIVCSSLYYPLLAWNGLSTFICMPLDSTPGVGEAASAQGQYWVMDLNMQCYQGEHLNFMLGFGLPVTLLVVLGWPVLLMALLLDARMALNMEESEKERRRLRRLRATFNAARRLLGVLGGFYR